jgi:hypothetical protein
MAQMQEQAEVIEQAIYEEIEKAREGDLDPEMLFSATGQLYFNKVDDKATWCSLIVYFRKKQVFTVNVACNRTQGATIVNCGRRIRNKTHFFYCSTIPDAVIAAKRYAKDHIIPYLEVVDD